MSKCRCCGRHPSEISEYVQLAGEYGITPDEVVRQEEGTYNPETGLFYCTDCYLGIGSPLGTA